MAAEGFRRFAVLMLDSLFSSPLAYVSLANTCFVSEARLESTVRSVYRIVCGATSSVQYIWYEGRVRWLCIQSGSLAYPVVA